MWKQKLISAVLFGLSLGVAFGVVSGAENLFGTTDTLVGIGSALILFHAGANPQMILKPFKHNTLADGQYIWVGRVGVVLILVGLIEVSGALSPTTYGI